MSYADFNLNQFDLAEQNRGHIIIDLLGIPRE